MHTLRARQSAFASGRRRRLYLDQACSSLYAYCRERLGYSEDAALKRARVARLVLRLPRVLAELRGGAIHLTGLFLLDRYLNEENADGLLAEARGTSRRELEKILAIRFPRPDVPSTIEPLGTLPLALVPEASDGVGPSGETEGPRREEACGPSPWLSCPETGTFGHRRPWAFPRFSIADGTAFGGKLSRRIHCEHRAPGQDRASTGASQPRSAER